MRGPRRREFSKAIRKLKFHGSTVLEAAGRWKGRLILRLSLIH